MIEAVDTGTGMGAKFRFACHNGLSCFTRCCADLKLVLTPYDILRLKRRLHLSSRAFLEKYTTATTDGVTGLPVVRLEMLDDPMRRCPFVTSDGCSVYEDRPGACRLYPLGKAVSQTGNAFRKREYYFPVKEPHCLGWREEKTWTVQEWLTDQGLSEYDLFNRDFLTVTTGKSANTLNALSDRHRQMFYTAFYNLDGFRQFIFQSTFFQRFEIEEGLQSRLQTDDIELMAFAGRWLRFFLFGENTLQTQNPASMRRDLNL